MAKTILIFANCRNPTAKGDYSLAGNIAKDLAKEKDGSGFNVVLTSTLAGIAQYESLYGKAVNGLISIAGISIGLCALELFDAIEHEVVAFIEANRCAYASADILRRVLSPDCKFLFIGAADRLPKADTLSQYWSYAEYCKQQPGIYEHFDEEDVLIGAAGLGDDRLGLPQIASLHELAPLTGDQTKQIPGDGYGFMYLNSATKAKVSPLIAQYIKLSGIKKTYVLVGTFASQSDEIEQVIQLDMTAEHSAKPVPKIHYHQSLANNLMRKMAAGAKGDLVVSTGTMSTLEIMHDGKLPYYQDLPSSAQFVSSYLIAVKSLCASNPLGAATFQFVIELSTLLFAAKPLNSDQMSVTQNLLSKPTVTQHLVRVNQQIIAKANGTLAANLLSFLGKQTHTEQRRQLISVCQTLRTQDETTIPVFDEALRRAAAWECLFELKVLIKSLTAQEVNKQSTEGQCYSALHWAVKAKFTEGVTLLIKAGAMLDIRDAQGKTPLHHAIANGDKPIIKLLVAAGALLDVTDTKGLKPADYGESWVSEYIKSCLTIEAITTAPAAPLK